MKSFCMLFELLCGCIAMPAFFSTQNPAYIRTLLSAAWLASVCAASFYGQLEVVWGITDRIFDVYAFPRNNFCKCGGRASAKSN
jgi:hypothetical protein